MSRSHLPKQLLPLLGSETMIHRTVTRLFPLFDAAHVHVICGRAYLDRIQKDLEMLAPTNIIDEPVGRDTAAAVGLAATYLEWKDPGSTWAMLAADHYIAPVDRFQAALQAAFDAAQDGSLVTFAIKPRFPATGYGYLERGDAIGKAWRVKRFCEKPDESRAKEFVAGGRHTWNSGMFVWRADSILREIERHLPDLHRELTTIRAALGTSRLPEVLAQAYGRMKKVSIDYGVMEKTDRALMIDAAFEWDDVGSWKAVSQYRPKDEQGNAFEALAAAVDTKDTYIASSDTGHLIGVVGLDGYVVVHTKDATLVCPKERSEDLKKLIDAIRAKGLDRLL